MGNCQGTNCCSKDSPDELILKHDSSEVNDVVSLAATRARPLVLESDMQRAQGAANRHNSASPRSQQQPSQSQLHPQSHLAKSAGAPSPDHPNVAVGSLILPVAQQHSNLPVQELGSGSMIDSENKITSSKSTRSIEGLAIDDKDSIRKTKNSQEPIKLERIAFKNGTTYEGTWFHGQKSGEGTQFWTDGSCYKGTWLCGKAQGFGRLSHPCGDHYDGELDLNKASGQGQYTHSSGARFIGEWKNDKQHGAGQEIWPDGTQYEGSYLEGKKHGGMGRLVFADSSHYEGTFVKGEIAGFGEYVWPDSRVYRGEWTDSKMHGFGRIKWKDGRTYSGQYSYDKKHGFGVFVWPDRKKYEGLWKDGLQSGIGIFTTSKGEKRLGTMVQGKCTAWILDILNEATLADAFTQIQEFAKSHDDEFGRSDSSSVVSNYAQNKHIFPDSILSRFE